MVGVSDFVETNGTSFKEVIEELKIDENSVKKLEMDISVSKSFDQGQNVES